MSQARNKPGRKATVRKNLGLVVMMIAVTAFSCVACNDLFLCCRPIAAFWTYSADEVFQLGASTIMCAKK